MTAPIAAIEVRSVTKAFGDHLAIDDLSFDVPAASVTGFVGPNGSGKTTMMRSIVGLTHPTSGSIRIEGKPLQELTHPRRQLGAVLDRLGAHPGLTARQHLELVVAGTRSLRRVDPALEQVGLAPAADRRIQTYSTGMKQRLALAAALIFEPSILLLDEPARGLDPAGMRWLRGLLRSAADRGSAVFVSTHQLAELGPMVDQLVIINEGQLVAADPAGDVLRRTRRERLDDAVLDLLDECQQRCLNEPGYS